MLLYIILAVVATAAAMFVVIALMHLAKIVYQETLELISQYRSERTKCYFEDDYLFTEWVEDFRKQPFSMMREYADAK